MSPRPHYRHCAAAFTQDFALSASFTVVPFYVFHHLGGGADMSGLIAAAQSICYGAACIVVGGFLAPSRHGNLWAAGGCLFFGLLVLAAPLFSHPVAFAVPMVASVIGLAAFWPFMQAWLGGERDSRARTRHLGHYHLSWCLGLATGPLAAGPLYVLDYRLGFALVFVSATLAGLLALTLPREEKHFGAGPEAGGAKEPEGDAASEAHLYATWLASFTGWVLIGVMRSVFPKRIDELVDAGELFLWHSGTESLTLSLESATQYSWLAFALYATRAGVSLLMGGIHTWRHRFGVLLSLQVAAAGAFFVLGTTHSLILMAAGCAVVGINGGVSFFASLEYSVSNRLRKNRRSAIHESMSGLGSSFGSLSFGLIAAKFGTSVPFVCTPLAIPAVLVAQLLLLRHGSRRQRSKTR